MLCNIETHIWNVKCKNLYLKVNCVKYKNFVSKAPETRGLGQLVATLVGSTKLLYAGPG